MNIHDKLSMLGPTVSDCAGRRLARIVKIGYAATTTSKAWSKAWHLLRLTGWRREFRAVPAISPRRGNRRSVHRAFTRAAVLGSRQRSRQGRRHGVSWLELNAFDAPAAGV